MSEHTIDTAMALSRLRGERTQLEAQLKAQTMELFGEPRLDGRQVTQALRRSFKDEMAPIPKATAYDLLGEIFRRSGNRMVDRAGGAECECHFVGPVIDSELIRVLDVRNSSDRNDNAGSRLRHRLADSIKRIAQ